MSKKIITALTVVLLCSTTSCGNEATTSTTTTTAVATEPVYMPIIVEQSVTDVSTELFLADNKIIVERYTANDVNDNAELFITKNSNGEYNSFVMYDEEFRLLVANTYSTDYMIGFGMFYWRTFPEAEIWAIDWADLSERPELMDIQPKIF